MSPPIQRDRAQLYREMFEVLRALDPAAPAEGMDSWRLAFEMARSLARRAAMGDTAAPPAFRRELQRRSRRAWPDTFAVGAEGFAEAAPPLVAAGALDAELLADLIVRRRFNVVRVPGYASKALCRRLTAAICARPLEVWRYTGPTGATNTDAYTVNIPAQNVVDEASRARYEAQDFELLRRLAAPHLSPLDRLRLELDELWPAGATVRNGRHRGRRLAGIVRVYKPSEEHPPLSAGDGLCRSRGDDGYVHIDDVATDRRQLFSASLYLDVPARGGELLVWNVRMPRFSAAWYGDYVRGVLANYVAHEILVGSLSGMNTVDPAVRAKLAADLPPPLVIRPEAGELVLINACVPHSVRDLPCGQRVSVQSFVREDRARPLRLMV